MRRTAGLWRRRLLRTGAKLLQAEWLNLRHPSHGFYIRYDLEGHICDVIGQSELRAYREAVLIAEDMLSGRWPKL